MLLEPRCTGSINRSWQALCLEIAFCSFLTLQRQDEGCGPKSCQWENLAPEHSILGRDFFLSVALFLDTLYISVHFQILCAFLLILRHFYLKRLFSKFFQIYCSCWYSSQPPQPAVVYFFQAVANFFTENAIHWTIFANLGFFVANSHTFSCNFTGNAVGSHNWQISVMIIDVTKNWFAGALPLASGSDVSHRQHLPHSCHHYRALHHRLSSLL